MKKIKIKRTVITILLLSLLVTILGCPPTKEMSLGILEGIY